MGQESRVGAQICLPIQGWAGFNRVQHRTFLDSGPLLETGLGSGSVAGVSVPWFRGGSIKGSQVFLVNFGSGAC